MKITLMKKDAPWLIARVGFPLQVDDKDYTVQCLIEKTDRIELLLGGVPAEETRVGMPDTMRIRGKVVPTEAYEVLGCPICGGPGPCEHPIEGHQEEREEDEMEERRAKGLPLIPEGEE